MLKAGSKVKVLVDGKWVLAKIAKFHDPEKKVAVVERSDQEGDAEHRTVYALTDDLRPAKDDTAS